MSDPADVGELLNSPWKIGPYVLKHRVVLPPLTRMRAGTSDGVPSSHAELYYQQRASEGGFMIAEATQVSKQGQGYPGTPGIYSQAQIEGWRRVTRAVKACGAVIFLQLWHVGRISHSSLQPGGGLPVAPSAVRPSGETLDASWKRVPYETPAPLSREQIASVVADYRQAAVNAREAGFDGVEIHSANGYLLDQFLEDHTNRREDEYGGGREERMRLLLEIVDATSAVWGVGKVGVRLSPFGVINDIADSNPQRLFAEVIKQLSSRQLGYLHLIEPRSNAGVREEANLSAPPSVAKMFRTVFQGPLIASGGFDRYKAGSVIADGAADAIAFGRAFLANPDLPRRLSIDAHLNAYHRPTFYGGSTKGYTDYPTLEEVSG
jgi:N-ethylmaleimide reductase